MDHEGSYTMDHYRPLEEFPRLVDETESYAVVYKPPLMFSAPLGGVLEGTLLGWYARRCPAVLEPAGDTRGEGGLLHRLDFETEGLVLLAKTQAAYESLRAQQAAGNFVKDYLAVTCSPRGAPAGRSPLPGFPSSPYGNLSPAGPPGPPACIESFFRPWGAGRRAVRPTGPGKGPKTAAVQGTPYRTEICGLRELPVLPGILKEGAGPLHIFSLRIFRGFRHQIRCHLAWIGAPILYDALYGGEDPFPVLGSGDLGSGDPVSGGGLWDKPCPRSGKGRHPIALRARAFRFFDPDTGEQKNYRLPPF
jgi:23S rRNA pseudouridine1911/1915/1917 synthase